MSEATGQVKAATAKPSTFPAKSFAARARPRRSRHIQSCAVNRCHRMCRLRFLFCGVCHRICIRRGTNGKKLWPQFYPCRAGT